MPTQRKIIVAMSGGVDSSVAASLLCEQGWDVVGLYLDTGVESGRLFGRETTEDALPTSSVRQVRAVADAIGVPVDVVDAHEDFEHILRAFADEYARGRTPNPCVLCNRRFKFAHLLEHVERHGADAIATGHYARVARIGGRTALLRGRDRAKEQSYYIHRIDRTALERLVLPLGELTKDEVRAVAEQRGLPVLDRPESQDVCFASEIPYAELVRRYHPDAFRPGQVQDITGRVVGEHEGVPNYTIGQRKGLGIAMGTPAYVARIDTEQNVVTLGPREALLQQRLTAFGATWLVEPSAEEFRALAQIRYRHRAAEATVRRLDGGRIEVVFDQPQWAITPGQAVALHDDDLVLGGAWIDRAIDA